MRKLHLFKKLAVLLFLSISGLSDGIASNSNDSEGGGCACASIIQENVNQIPTQIKNDLEPILKNEEKINGYIKIIDSRMAATFGKLSDATQDEADAVKEALSKIHKMRGITEKEISDDVNLYKLIQTISGGDPSRGEGELTSLFELLSQVERRNAAISARIEAKKAQLDALQKSHRHMEKKNGL